MASPWGKIEKVETVNFAEIMSEEYARGLQNEEIRKCGEEIRENLVRTAGCSKENEKDPVERNVEIIPEDVLKAIQEDGSLSEAAFGEVCGSDALIAQVLQSQFDHEYNEELKRIENQKNKDSKVRISLTNYRRNGDLESDEEEYDDDEDLDNPKRDWDRFETNEKLFETIPKSGYKVDKEGEVITKHDPQICGVRNACRVMSFPPEIPTGDAAGFDMKLSNAVFNQLKSYSRKSSKNKTHDRKENLSTAEMSVDVRTRLIMYKLVNSQVLEQISGIVSTGKEALILHADSDPNYPGEPALPKECAVKIFRTTLNEFKQRDRYIKDDYRFKGRYKKQNNDVVINMWAEKEMYNLRRMEKCGINCPKVVALKKHVLVMSFIGHNQIAAPKLKNARLSEAELSVAYEEIVQIMHKLYNEAKLVHADLSEYNILWQDGQCYIIDVAQSVEPEHPSALEFLMRDCSNIITFFTRSGLPNIFTTKQLFEHITGLNAESYNAAMLERIHDRGAPLRVAAAPNQDSMPDEIRPLEFPFDMAWEKSIQGKEREKDLNGEPPAAVVESVEALQILEIQRPAECDPHTVEVCEN